MSVIDWDETPSAGDCFDETSWSNMVQYIKHSSSCTFTIYDDESSANQKFKFTYSGDDSIVEGGAVTGDDLILKSNSADAYPKIELLGDADIKEYFKVGSAFYLYDSAVQALKVKYATNVSTIEGGHTAGDDLVLKANDMDVYPYIKLRGQEPVVFVTHTASTFDFFDGANWLCSLYRSAPDITLAGGTGFVDSNIYLKPNGAGLVKFGTYSAKGAEAFDGFITIKDAAENTRKLMTCA